jgi:small subunit ribosomal protein S16
MRRIGRRNRPYYRIVAADHRRARAGKFLEILGTYDPIVKPAQIKLFEDRLTKWLNEGAEPSDTVRTLLTQIGFTTKYLKAKKGEDVSTMEIRSSITERKKKTRKMKKAVVADAPPSSAAEAKPAAAEKPAEPAEEGAKE